MTEDLFDRLQTIKDRCDAHLEKAGWYRNPNTGKPIERNFGEVVALMHSELSEALEAHRKNLTDADTEACEAA